MTMTNKNTFSLHNPDKAAQKEYDLSASAPIGYKELDENKKIHIAEFSEFIFANREGIAIGKDLQFHIRNHDNRPMMTELAVPEDKPARYEELTELERFHIYEFMKFLTSEN